MRHFGSIRYVHKKQGKLDPRAMKVVFLGYPKGIKGYRLWSLDEKKVVISRDVVFNEKIFYKTNLQVPKQFHRTDNFQFEVENISQDKVSGGNCDDLQGANLENDQLRTDEELKVGLRTLNKLILS